MRTEPVQFIGLGGEASGSGFIYTYLQAHPQICIPPQATGFFTEDERYQRGVAWYAAQFRACKKSAVVGEVSSDYLEQPDAADRIAATVPSARLIAVICDPIARLYRAYTRAKDAERIPAEQSFARYIDAHPEELEKGLFGRHLQAYFNLYSPVNLLVLLHEDRYDDPVAHIQSVYRFLEVDDSFVPRPLRRFVEIDPNNPPPRPWYLKLIRLALFPIFLLRLDRLVLWAWGLLQPYLRRWLTPRPTTGPGSKPPGPQPLPIDPELRSVLVDYYAADVRALSHLLQRDMNTKWDIHPSA